MRCRKRGLTPLCTRKGVCPPFRHPRPRRAENGLSSGLNDPNHHADDRVRLNYNMVNFGAPRD